MTEANMTPPPSVVIFGASSGIAEAVARAYATTGARLHLIGRADEALEAMRRDLIARGAPDVLVTVADLVDCSRHAPLAREIAAATPQADVVLIAWGTLSDQARSYHDPAYAAAELQNNFVAPANLCLRLAEDWRWPDHAVLAVITSVAGDRGRRSNFVYGAAKGGLQRFLEGLRHDLYGRGIAVLDVRPGFVTTPMTDGVSKQSLLWADPATVAGDIVAAIKRRRAVIYTPWFWRWVMLMICLIPRPIFHRLKL